MKRNAFLRIISGKNALPPPPVTVVNTITYVPIATGTMTFKPDDDSVGNCIVRCWGSGATGGGKNTGGAAGGRAGGSGGQFAQKTISGLSRSTTYSCYAGKPASTTGFTGVIGVDTTFQTNVVVAKGGKPPTSLTAGGVGSTTGGIGDIVYAGGNGAGGSGTTAGGGGGGGAGSTGAGNPATGSTGGVAKVNNGGAGGNGKITTAGVGGGGSAAGGGGGGALATGTSGSYSGGVGGAGRIEITNVRLAQYQLPDANMSNWTSNHVNCTIVNGIMYMPSTTGSYGSTIYATYNFTTTLYAGVRFNLTYTMDINLSGQSCCGLYIDGIMAFSLQNGTAGQVITYNNYQIPLGVKTPIVTLRNIDNTLNSISMRNFNITLIAS